MAPAEPHYFQPPGLSGGRPFGPLYSAWDDAAANPDATNDSAANPDAPMSFVANPDATIDAGATTEIVAPPKPDAITAYPHEPVRVG